MKTSFRIVILLLSGAFLLSSVSCGKAASGAGKAACKAAGKLIQKSAQHADDGVRAYIQYNGGDDNKRSKRGSGGYGGGYNHRRY